MENLEIEPGTRYAKRVDFLECVSCCADEDNDDVRDFVDSILYGNEDDEKIEAFVRSCFVCNAKHQFVILTEHSGKVCGGEFGILQTILKKDGIEVIKTTPFFVVEETNKICKRLSDYPCLSAGYGDYLVFFGSDVIHIAQEHFDIWDDCDFLTFFYDEKKFSGAVRDMLKTHEVTETNLYYLLHDKEIAFSEAINSVFFRDPYEALYVAEDIVKEFVR